MRVCTEQRGAGDPGAAWSTRTCQRLRFGKDLDFKMQHCPALTGSLLNSLSICPHSCTLDFLTVMEEAFELGIKVTVKKNCSQVEVPH